MAPPPTLPDRDTVTTIREDGGRRFLFPADVTGRFSRGRRTVGLGLIVLYLSLPWIRVGGYPAVFLDVANRRFHLFGLTLATQDLWLLFFLISGVGFSLIFVTSLLGRIWCGWACPQTVFVDQIYRRIERWTEGDAGRRRELDAAPWTGEKLARRSLKHALYLLVSVVVTHLFLAYYVSVPELWSMMRAAPAEHWGLFLFIAAATGAIYFDFGWFREQFCVILCPYGRIQSALTDDHTLVIGYDAKRGEPRGKAGTTGAGDCVSCNRCVQVCPTGIDIRQGLQLECIGCAACVDACDTVMRHLGRPTGLVRYDSLNGLANRPTRLVRPRTVLYAILLFLEAVAATWAFSTVRPASLSVVRITGFPYFVDSRNVRNQFFVRIVNKRTVPARFLLQAQGAPANVAQSGFSGTVEVPALAEIVQPLILEQPRSGYAGPFSLQVRLRDAAGTFTLQRTVEFLGPDPALLREDAAGRPGPR